MLGFERSGCRTLGTSLQGVLRAGTLCGVFAMLMLCTGCPMMTPCTMNSDCNDQNNCTTDACGADGFCTFTEVVCPEGQTCNPASGQCGVECNNAGDCPDDGNVCTSTGCADGFCTTVNNVDPCDDGSACTENDVCANGACGGTAVNCDDGDACTDDSCDPATGCANTARDCNDNDACTDDSCDPATGCVNTPTAVAAGCDNGDFCDGAETCDPATGNCVAGTNPCADGQTCDETNDECLDAAPCDPADDMCDDGMFCNGTETCGADGFCAPGTNPCTATQTCDEAADVCRNPTGDTFEFTLNVDNFTGTAGDDMFVAPIGLANGAQTPTLGIGDTADGQDGDDALTATLIGMNGTISAFLSNIETFNISDFSTAGSWTFTGSTITGLTTINSMNSLNTNPLIFNNLGSVVDIGLTNTNAGMTVSYTAAATMGAADDMGLALSNVQGGTVTVTSANSNGIESMSISSDGVANTLTQITQTTGTTLASVAISGSQSLTITNALPTTVSTVNASMSTGGVNVSVANNAGNVTVTGGSGNDTFTLGANYTNTDTVDGGDGTGDVLGLTSAAANVGSNQTNVTNIEGLSISNMLVNSINATRFGAITSITLNDGVNMASTLTVASGTTINLNAGTDSTANLTVDVGGLGTSDTVSVTLNDHDTGNALIFTGAETLNLTSNRNLNGTDADGGTNTNVVGGALTMTPTFGGGTVNITGTANLTLTGAVTAGTINAGTYTGNLIMGTASAGAISILTGSGNDTIFGSNASDTLNAGSGTNAIEGRGGVDSVTLGAGVDTLRIAVGAANGVDRKLVSGFTAGTGGDVINIDANDFLTLSGTNNFADANAIQNHGTAGAVTVGAATEVLRVTSATVANFTDANSLNGTNLLTAVGGNVTMNADGDQILIVVADASGNVGVYVADEGADAGAVLAAGDITLVAVLQSVTIGNLVFSNFTNVN